ncbi:hypothetical protein B0A55_09591 [Friedmanniomyces simplex]|uniref:Uncharacterized protein n=1 Tax=Friedmanniomyces simplex TaxID=329884 RepID=A0A4U0WP53_9PEZI|nr:hypothetical protein B0A55_09591 [Friedmanniomyces simplex]
MASFTQKLREKLSKRSLRPEPSKTSMATQSSTATSGTTSTRSIFSAGATRHPSVTITPTVTPQPSTSSFRLHLLEKKKSVSAFLRTMFTRSSRSNSPSPTSSANTTSSFKTSSGRSRSKAPTIPAPEAKTPAAAAPVGVVPTATPTKATMPIVIPPSKTPTIIAAPPAARKFSTPPGPPPTPAVIVTPTTPVAAAAVPAAITSTPAPPAAAPALASPAAPIPPPAPPAAPVLPALATPPAKPPAPAPPASGPPPTTPANSAPETSRDISTATPIPGGNTAVEREEALAQLRKTGQVYPQSKGQFDGPIPTSERQEDHSYPKEKPRSVTKPKAFGKTSLFWTALKAKMFVHKEEKKVENVGNKVDKKLKPVGGAGGAVAGRIRQLEEKAQVEAKKMNITRRPFPGLANASVPRIYPLHVNHFMRRSGSAAPVRAETPLYRSPPDDEPLIHAPQPTKSIPMLGRQSPGIQHAPTVYQTPPSFADNTAARDEKPTKSVRVTSPYIRSNNKIALHSPAAYLSGTKEKCVRHGRKRELRATNDMQDKGRTGAYHPTGFTVRQQTEATSPWSIASLTNKQGLADPCPDCRAELSIRRREAMQTVMRPTDAGAGGHVTEPVLEVNTLPEKAAPRRQDKPRQPRSTRETSTAEPHDDLVITQDLGDGLDAAIFVRGGELERVIINTRLARPTTDAVHKLSKDMLSVSQALAVAGVGTPVAAAVHTRQERAVIFDTPSRGRRRRYSVSELLDLVDQAVDTMHDPTHDDDDCQPAGTRLVHSESFHDATELQKAASDHKKLEGTAGERNTAQPDEKPEPAKTARFAIPTITTTKPSVLSSSSGVPIPGTVTQSPPNDSDLMGSSTKVKKPSTAPSGVLSSAASTIGSAAKPVADAAQQALPSTTNVTKTLATVTDVFKSAADTLTSNVQQTVSDILPPIASNPSPYHHAPDTPRSLNVAQWVDKQVQEAQQLMRNAMRMQKEAAVAQAAAVEKEVKKQRSVIGKAEKALVGGGWSLFGGSGSHPSADH